MDIFKFHNPVHAMRMQGGEIINGIKSKMWIERHTKEGEFSLVVPIDTGILQKLPLGSFISHIDSDDIMIVENYEINSSKDKETEVKISGRSFEVLPLEARVPGANRSYPVSDGLPDVYIAAADPAWQIVSFIENRFVAGHLVYSDDEIPYIKVYTYAPAVPDADARYLKVGGDGLQVCQDLMTAENLGLQIIRPGAYSRASAVTPDDFTAMLVHPGSDLRATVVFSYDLGEIESADYFWSIRNKKTLAVVTGKWAGVRVGTGAVNQDRRMLHVDAQNIDNLYNVAPTGSALTQIQNGMTRRGLDALKKKQGVNISNVQISKEGTRMKYRKDFIVGDIITVAGEFNTAAPFRVTEYVEIEDENGASGYPTLEPA